MRRLGLATVTALLLLAASAASAPAASARVLSGDDHPTLPKLQTGAIASPFATGSIGGRPRGVITPAPVACDGKFDVVASPNSTGDNYLFSVAAINANDVWAVGSSTSSNFYDRTLAEHWNGSTWTRVATPNPSAYHADLTSVSAIASNNVWAVGAYQYDAAGHWHTFTLHWNGTSWALSTSTVNPTPLSFLSAVTAISSNDIWAVGTFNSAGWLTLIEHWDGSTWTWISASPNVSPSDNELVAVSAFSSTDVWAVGAWSGTSTVSTPLHSLAEHWNGSAWSVITTADADANNNVITGVSALEAGLAVGVGFGNYVAGLSPRTGEAWNLIAAGGSTAQYEAGPGSGDNVLEAVARSGAGVWAVGYSRSTPTSARQTLVIPATWTGSNLIWGAYGQSDSPSAVNNALLGVAAVTPSVFWATGYSTNGTVNQTLTEMYCGVHFVLSAPPTATVGVPFSLTVTATNADASTATTYVGTVHFSSTDFLALLPSDYTFTPGDAGTHTFTGVVLNRSYSQTITANDTVTPFVKGSVTIVVSCLGACQSPAGTPGARDILPSLAGAAGARDANQSPNSTPGPRLPQYSGASGR